MVVLQNPHCSLPFSVVTCPLSKTCNALISKHLSLCIATAVGHQDQNAKHLWSTRVTRIPHLSCLTLILHQCYQLALKLSVILHQNHKVHIWMGMSIILFLSLEFQFHPCHLSSCYHLQYPANCLHHTGIQELSGETSHT